MSLFILAAELTNNQVAGAVVGTGGVITVSTVLIWLKLNKAIDDRIRSVSGTTPATKVSVGGQPLEVREAVIHATSSELAKLEKETSDRLKAVEKYTHDSVHELRGALQTITNQQSSANIAVAAMERSTQELKAGLNSLQKETSELNGAIERLDERTETTNATVAELGRKIDLILTRLPK